MMLWLNLKILQIWFKLKFFFKSLEVNKSNVDIYLFDQMSVIVISHIILKIDIILKSLLVIMLIQIVSFTLFSMELYRIVAGQSNNWSEYTDMSRSFIFN